MVNDKTFLLLVVTVANKTQFLSSPEATNRYYAGIALNLRDKDKAEADAVTKCDRLNPQKALDCSGAFLVVDPRGFEPLASSMP